MKQEANLEIRNSGKTGDIVLCSFPNFLSSRLEHCSRDFLSSKLVLADLLHTDPIDPRSGPSRRLSTNKRIEPGSGNQELTKRVRCRFLFFS